MPGNPDPKSMRQQISEQARSSALQVCKPLLQEVWKPRGMGGSMVFPSPLGRVDPSTVKCSPSEVEPGSLSAATHHQGMAAGRIKGINVAQEPLPRGLPKPRKLVCRATKAKQGPLPSPREQGACDSREVQNASWPLTFIPQDLPQLCKPTELPPVPSQDAKSSISGEKKPVLPPHVHSQVCKSPSPHLASFLQGTWEQGPQGLHALSPAGDPQGV